MSEQRIVERTKDPQTLDSLTASFHALGLKHGDTVLVHASLSALGWVVGQEVTVIQALLKAIGPTGSLMMPSHCAGNSEPSHWAHPPVPETWWSLIRDTMPAFDPHITPTRGMGRIAECFRTFPGVQRSSHPEGSFAACGPLAKQLVGHHAHTPMFGDETPLGALVRCAGKVLLLGVGYDSCTLLHLAEVRAAICTEKVMGHALFVKGVRTWVTVTDYDYDDELFPILGRDYEKSHPLGRKTIGLADCRLLDADNLVHFGTHWLQRHTKVSTD